MLMLNSSIFLVADMVIHFVVADMVFCVADMVVADMVVANMVCGRYGTDRCLTTTETYNCLCYV